MDRCHAKSRHSALHFSDQPVGVNPSGNKRLHQLSQTWLIEVRFSTTAVTHGPQVRVSDFHRACCYSCREFQLAPDDRDGGFELNLPSLLAAEAAAESDLQSFLRFCHIYCANVSARNRVLAERQRSQRDEPERLEAEARKLRREIDRFLALVADGKAPGSVLTEIKRREQRLAEVDGELQTLRIETPPDGDLRRLKASFSERLARFDDLLLSDVPMARQALRKLIPGRIEFRPVERDGKRGYDLRWSLATRALVEGNIGMASPRGFEPRLPP